MSDKSINFWVIWHYIYAFAYLLYSFFSSIYNRGTELVWLAITQAPKRESQFTVYIYESELKNIHEWVLKKDNIETGGDLFGLWIDEHTAVVQLVLGPGKECRRTSVSFFQDVDYLAKTGAVITNKHGLCNIGQWHSHHRLRLDKPSAGDEETVWGNMPGLGLNRYIVFIATISGYGGNSKVNVNPFLFEIENETGKQLPVMQGTWKVLEAFQSPVRLNGNLSRELKDGAESMPHDASENMYRRDERNESMAIDMS